MSLRLDRKVISVDVVLGIPSLFWKVDKVCGDCQADKQIGFTHRKVSECSTERVLELLHMDLMGPMQVESLGGKRYVFFIYLFICIDDFSKYTWVQFIRDKFDTFQVCQTLCRQLQRE